MDRTVRLEIRGVVQGVGFRASLAGEARRAGLRGWVRNRRDGSVEAMAQGAPDAVGRLVEWARTGPPGAVVESVRVVDTDGNEGGGGTDGGFELRPTA